jgi:hypothetical protein
MGEEIDAASWDAMQSVLPAVGWRTCRNGMMVGVAYKASTTMAYTRHGDRYFVAAFDGRLWLDDLARRMV